MDWLSVQRLIFMYLALCPIKSRFKFCLFSGQYALYLHCFCLKACIKRESRFQALGRHNLYYIRDSLSLFKLIQ